MIRSMYVKNFVLIDALSLDFHNAYSCFTGETGAGKSLLIDAIGILCGERVNASYIQKGAQSALIEAVIEIEDVNHIAYQLLSDNHFELEDQCFVISREFSMEGKSTTKINQRTTTLSFVKEVLSTLIDIHSQHDNQYLLNDRYHLSLLDEYCHHEILVDEVKTLYKKYQEKQREYDHFTQQEANPDDLAYYEFQLEEMQRLDIKENELEDLETQQKEMSNYDKLSTQLNQTISEIENSRYDCIYDATKLLQEPLHPDLIKSKEELLSAYYTIDEQVINLKTYVESLAFDEQVYDAIQTRLFTIHNALRKHGNSYSSYQEKMQEYKDKIEAIENRESHVVKLAEEKEHCYQLFVKKATILSHQRQLKAIELEKEIQHELLDLHIEHAQCKIQFDKTISIHGIDQVEFMISMNTGVPLQPLAKVASGGELSRLMLGLKNIFNRLQKIQTVIFDEIDNGVSGTVAYAIGKKMHDLASESQVFSVTHLAPVASWADYHYLVNKTQTNHKTTTQIKKLEKNAIIKELATIAQGSNSETALLAAQELYESCHQK